MKVTVHILGTGSAGNAVAITTAHGTLLVDAGFSRKDLFSRARKAGMDPTQITAVMVSHEHNDHIAGAMGLAKELRVPIYATKGTCLSLCDKMPSTYLRDFECGRVVGINTDCAVYPVASPHDAAQPCSFRVETGGKKIVVALDLGCITPEVNEHLKGCDLIVLESNYDEGMLANGPYPQSVKKRVASQTGHLSTRQVADFLSSSWDGRGRIVLAHLSQHNTTPDVALRSAMRAVVDRGLDPAAIRVSLQDDFLLECL